MTLRVLAVDDEQPALDDLAYALRADGRVTSVVTANDAPDALRMLDQGGVDAVFLDVRMPGLSGVDLARVLARFLTPPPIVFVTAYDAHAVDAFDIGALDYVLKPVRTERIAEAVRRVCDAIAERRSPERRHTPTGSLDETIPVELGSTVRFVSRSDVAFVEAAGDYARLHTAGTSHLVRVPLTTLEERWSDAFVRIHRSYLVNLRHIDELRFDGAHYSVRVAGHELQVSRRHGHDLRDRLVRHARPGTGGMS